jgi:hypothetical protein
MNTLTASELIEALQKLPPNKPVIMEFPVRRAYPYQNQFDWVKRRVAEVDPGFGQRVAWIAATEDL